MKIPRQTFLAALLAAGAMTAPFAQSVWTSRSTTPGAAAVWTGSQIAVSNTYGGVATSSDGLTWANPKSVTSSNLVSLAWTGPTDGTGSGLFVAVGGTVSAGTVITSPDGVTWTVRTSGTGNYLNGVVWTGSLLVAVGGKGAIITSPDGITWTSRTPGNGSELFAVTWMGPSAGNAAGQLFAVGDGGAFTSPDGVTWTQHDMVGSRRYGIIWTGSQLVAVGTGGTVATSPDGVTWTSQAWGGGQYLRSVVWTGKQLVAVGNEGTIAASSDDGATWAIHASGTAGHLFAVIWTGTQLVAAGNDGVFTSPEDSVTTAVASRPSGLAKLSLRVSETELFAALPKSLQGPGTGAAIYTTAGVEVFSVQDLGGKDGFAVPISAFKSGVYFLEVRGARERVVQAFPR